MLHAPSTPALHKSRSTRTLQVLALRALKGLRRVTSRSPTSQKPLTPSSEQPSPLSENGPQTDVSSLLSDSTGNDDNFDDALARFEDRYPAYPSTRVLICRMHRAPSPLYLSEGHLLPQRGPESHLGSGVVRLVSGLRG